MFHHALGTMGLVSKWFRQRQTCFILDRFPNPPRRGFIDRARKIARKSNHGFVVAARSDALEVMQGNFRKTINADGHHSASHTN
jgi:hypothetical protein